MVLIIAGLCLFTMASKILIGSSTLGASQPGGQLDPSFQYVWVTQTDVFDTKPTNETSIQIAATAAVHTIAFSRGSRLVYLLVRYMPNDLFMRVANTITVGIFNSDEFPSEFPEYAPTNPECECKLQYLDASI
ncbi:uncharacterized protein LOC117341810 [Pecten maximus]|uniref:uncharacterized protein LOC117341810 n=1 Tax=Pecten maximus TaxID=6579 RepID=UPI0014588F93|nr:uncharacterized protein LOC117341810 [Pecten maximus]